MDRKDELKHEFWDALEKYDSEAIKDYFKKSDEIKAVFGDELREFGHFIAERLTSYFDDATWMDQIGDIPMESLIIDKELCKMYGDYMSLEHYNTTRKEILDAYIAAGNVDNPDVRKKQVKSLKKKYSMSYHTDKHRSKYALHLMQFINALSDKVSSESGYGFTINERAEQIRKQEAFVLEEQKRMKKEDLSRETWKGQEESRAKKQKEEEAFHQRRVDFADKYIREEKTKRMNVIFNHVDEIAREFSSFAKTFKSTDSSELDAIKNDMFSTYSIDKYGKESVIYTMFITMFSTMVANGGGIVFGKEQRENLYKHYFDYFDQILGSIVVDYTEFDLDEGLGADDSDTIPEDEAEENQEQEGAGEQENETASETNQERNESASIDATIHTYKTAFWNSIITTATSAGGDVRAEINDAVGNLYYALVDQIRLRKSNGTDTMWDFPILLEVAEHIYNHGFEHFEAISAKLESISGTYEVHGLMDKLGVTLGKSMYADHVAGFDKKNVGMEELLDELASTLIAGPLPDTSKKAILKSFVGSVIDTSKFETLSRPAVQEYISGLLNKEFMHGNSGYTFDQKSVASDYLKQHFEEQILKQFSDTGVVSGLDTFGGFSTLSPRLLAEYIRDGSEDFHKHTIDERLQKTRGRRFAVAKMGDFASRPFVGLYNLLRRKNPIEKKTIRTDKFLDKKRSDEWNTLREQENSDFKMNLAVSESFTAKDENKDAMPFYGIRVDQERNNGSNSDEVGFGLDNIVIKYQRRGKNSAELIEVPGTMRKGMFLDTILNEPGLHAKERLSLMWYTTKAFAKSLYKRIGTLQGTYNGKEASISFRANGEMVCTVGGEVFFSDEVFSHLMQGQLDETKQSLGFIGLQIATLYRMYLSLSEQCFARYRDEIDNFKTLAMTSYTSSKKSKLWGGLSHEWDSFKKALNGNGASRKPSGTIQSEPLYVEQVDGNYKAEDSGLHVLSFKHGDAIDATEFVQLDDDPITVMYNNKFYRLQEYAADSVYKKAKRGYKHKYVFNPKTDVFDSLNELHRDGSTIDFIDSMKNFTKSMLSSYMSAEHIGKGFRKRRFVFMYEGVLHAIEATNARGGFSVITLEGGGITGLDGLLEKRKDLLMTLQGSNYISQTLKKGISSEIKRVNASLEDGNDNKVIRMDEGYDASNSFGINPRTLGLRRGKAKNINAVFGNMTFVKNLMHALVDSNNHL